MIKKYSFFFFTFLFCSVGQSDIIQEQMPLLEDYQKACSDIQTTLEDKLQNYIEIAQHITEENKDSDHFFQITWMAQDCADAIVNDVFQDTDSQTYVDKIESINRFVKDDTQGMMCDLGMSLRERWEEDYLLDIYNITRGNHNTDRLLIDLLQLRFSWTALTAIEGIPNHPLISRVARYFKIGSTLIFGGTHSEEAVAIAFFQDNHAPIDPSLIINCPVSGSIAAMNFTELGEQIQAEITSKLTVVGLNGLIIAAQFSSRASSVGSYLARIRHLRWVFTFARGAASVGAVAGSAGPQVLITIASVGAFYGIERYVGYRREQNYRDNLLAAQNRLEALISGPQYISIEGPTIWNPTINQYNQIYTQARDVLLKTYQLMSFYSQPLTQAIIDFRESFDAPQQPTQLDWEHFLMTVGEEIITDFPSCEISDNRKWYEKTQNGDYCENPNALLVQMSAYFAYLHENSRQLWTDLFTLGFLDQFSKGLQIDVIHKTIFWNN